MVCIDDQLRRRVPILIFEMKKSGGDPLSQAIAYYGNYILRAPVGYEAIYIQSPVPCFLLTLNGATLDLSCIHYSGTSGFHVDLLDSLHVLTLHKPKMADKMISFLSCLQSAVRELKASYAPHQLMPNPSRFPFFQSTDSISNIQYVRVVEGKEGKLFSGFIGSERCFVKVSPSSYGIEAHRSLLNSFPCELVAPRIFDFDPNLVFDHHVVIMEDLYSFLPLDVYINRPLPLMKRFGEIRSRLEVIISKMHELGFVHGDIRRPNILVNTDPHARVEELVALIDFDWADKAGIARYPMALNPNISWPDGAYPRGLISKDHDQEMMEQVLDSILLFQMYPDVTSM